MKSTYVKRDLKKKKLNFLEENEKITWAIEKKRKRLKQKQWPEDEMVREARILL